LINKFRGDPALLEPAIKATVKLTKKRVLGVIPRIDLQLPEEDSLDGGSRRAGTELPQESWNWQLDLLAKTIKDNVDVERLQEVAGL
jgi:adenosylcobyric acid synthase